MFYKTTLLAWIFLLTITGLRSQCMLVERPLEDVLTSSQIVVEGKVLSQQSYWDIDDKNIYTVNEIAVFKYFKGTPSLSTISVVTQGGTVDLEMHRVSNALELETGQMGLFVLEGFPLNLRQSGSFYRPVDTVLGFFDYDLNTGVANGTFETFQDIQSLYDVLLSVLGVPYTTILPWDAEDASITPTSSTESALQSDMVSSSNVDFDFNAGVGDIMIITGDDFGDDEGSVLFEDANSGGRNFIAAIPDQIHLWKSDSIVVEVPYRAGTGKIRIDKSTGESLVSSEDVLLGYDHINVKYTDDNGLKSYETQLVATNGQGGYDFRYQTDFAANDGAANAFTNILETWGCATGVNFNVGDVTDVDEDAADGINIVRFDNGTELGGSTLAYARSRYSGCYQGDTIKWFVYEIEVVVNDDYNWYYGDGQPANNQFDFETVILHEVGHAQQLGHVINSNEVMHFSVGAGQQKRSLSTIDALGGSYVSDKSISESVCNVPQMQAQASCCDEMVVLEQPMDVAACPNEESIAVQFDVANAATFQWQVWNGTTWENLEEGNGYTGVNTGNLEITKTITDTITLRCLAENSCGDTLVSSEAKIKVVLLDFTIALAQPTCTSNGSISIIRADTDSMFALSLNNGESFDYAWETDKEELLLSVPEGTYTPKVKQVTSDCMVVLETVTLDPVVPLQISVTIANEASCKGDDGVLRITNNDHPNFENFFLSLDGGASYDTYADNLETIEIENLPAGSYQITAKWENETCSTDQLDVLLETQGAPQLSFSVQQPECYGEKGSMSFTAVSSSKYSAIALSLDNGMSYPYLIPTDEAVHVIEDLAEGTYQIRIKWNDDSCPIYVDTAIIEGPALEVGQCIPFEFSLDANGEYQLNPKDVYDDTMEKGCPEVILELEQIFFDCADVGEKELVLTIMDKTGKTTECTTVVTVLANPEGCVDSEEDTDSNIPSEENEGTPEDTDTTDSTLGEIFSATELRLYPNPSSEKFRIAVGAGDNVKGVQIFNTAGTILGSGIPKRVSTGVYEMDISNVQSGVYFVKLLVNAEIKIRKLVIK